MKKLDKIAIFGPYPPPLGGISVHIQRMEFFLKQEKIDYTIFDHGHATGKNVITTNKSLVWYIKALFIKDFSLFHFHQFFYFHYLFYVLFYYLNSTPFIITIHEESLFSDSAIKNKISFWLLKKLKNTPIISVSEKLNNKLLSIGLNATYLPAYVKPVGINKQSVTKSNRNYFLFSTWKIDKRLSEEIYNVPLIFEFLKENKQEFIMLYMIGNKASSDLEYLNDLIAEYGLKDDIVLLFDKQLIDYLHNCKFLIRTNLEDGYGVSLQEAMDLGVPAIASNVCTRPKGTILFNNNDIQDLTQKIKYTITTDSAFLVSQKEELKYHQELVELYKSYL